MSPTEIREFKAAFNKAAEELSGTELLRKDFVNNFSHEFKTPIVSISGFADLLLDEDVTPEEQREYLQIIRDESKRLAQLSGSVLLLNRIEAQTILTDCTDFSLDEQLRQCILVTRQKWRDKPLQFEAELAPCTYHGSEALVKEIWLNLLDNAAKFSPENGTISVTLHCEQGRPVVAVTDQGCGMDAETCCHIFEQFYQGDTSHRTQGNGLGLAMAQKKIAAPARRCCHCFGQPPLRRRMRHAWAYYLFRNEYCLMPVQAISPQDHSTIPPKSAVPCQKGQRTVWAVQQPNIFIIPFFCPERQA